LYNKQIVAPFKPPLEPFHKLEQQLKQAIPFQKMKESAIPVSGQQIVTQNVAQFEDFGRTMSVEYFNQMAQLKCKQQLEEHKKSSSSSGPDQHITNNKSISSQ
jgi:hypothetical protein